MTVDLTVKIGGEAGQGIQTVGLLLAAACRDLGFYVMAVNDFESRIRGGHSFFQMRISDQPVSAPSLAVDLLVALNQETCNLHRHELTEGGLVILDSGDDKAEPGLIPVPFAKIAKDVGKPIYANTVAAAASLCLLGAPFDTLEKILEAQFAGKSEAVLESNLTAARKGYDAVSSVDFKTRPLTNASEVKGQLIDGSRAVALGAVSADCRMAAFYPMSPATSILSHLIGYSKSLPLVVEQAEDEIAAINMAIGASFAGVRAMTATSGGGFCLMTEGLGLAAITETPVVIVNAMRPGPSTGLPTRTAQGDLQFVIHASQDEFPRFVFAPGSPREAFDLTARAFLLSEKYQVPTIVLVDQYLADSLTILEEPFKACSSVERFIVHDKDLSLPAEYHRFQITESGISPRALPCQGDALVVISSDEHTEDGHITEEIEHRIAMADKRMAKLPAMTAEMDPPAGINTDARILLVGWGSSAGAIKEAAQTLKEQGLDAGCLIFTSLWPFPAEAARNLLAGKDRRIWMIELNQTAQLGQLIRQETGIPFSDTLLKYDGRPFYPADIVEAVLTKEEN